jgi:hypothetical protein
MSRQLLGDVALAALAALVALSSPGMARPDSAIGSPRADRSVSAANAVVALASSGDRQVGLYR